MQRTRQDIDNLLKPRIPGQLSEAEASRLILQLMILGTDSMDVEALRYYVRFFTPQDYDDLIEERTVISRCGYPLCHQALRDSRGNIRNPASRTILPWQHSYCQLTCYQAGKFYREQLSVEPLVTRKDVAYLDYGSMMWEYDVLILDEIRVLASMNRKTVLDTVKEIVHQQTLVSALEKLQIDHEEEIRGKKEIDGSIQGLTRPITERFK